MVRTKNIMKEQKSFDEVEWYFNKKNTRIKKCCASCLHHQLGDNQRQGTCLCSKYHKERYIDYLCSSGWEIDTRKQLRSNVSLDDIVLKADGKVQRPQYVEFVKNELERMWIKNVPLAERYAIQQSWPVRFEKMTGMSRYLNIPPRKVNKFR